MQIQVLGKMGTTNIPSVPQQPAPNAPLSCPPPTAGAVVAAKVQFLQGVVVVVVVVTVFTRVRLGGAQAPVLQCQ